MALSLDDLKDIDANDMPERPVLPKGEYVVEFGTMTKKEMKDKNDNPFTNFSAALTVVGPVNVSQDDLDAEAASWGGGDAADLLEKAQLWFRKPAFDLAGYKDLHKSLQRGFGVEYLPDIATQPKGTKGLQAIASVDVEVYDGVRRNTDVKRIRPVE